MLFFADLDDAIEQLTDGKRADLECPAVREQLREWLIELKWSREILNYQCKNCGFFLVGLIMTTVFLAKAMRPRMRMIKHVNALC